MQWDTVLAQADVLSSGRAQSTLSDHHIKHTRPAHQESLASLSLLRKDAYSQYSSTVQGPLESFKMWSKRQSADIHLFKYSSLVICSCWCAALCNHFCTSRCAMSYVHRSLLWIIQSMLHGYRFTSNSVRSIQTCMLSISMEISRFKNPVENSASSQKISHANRQTNYSRGMAALHEEYVKTRLEKGTVPLSDTIKRNNRLTSPTVRIPKRRETKWEYWSKITYLSHNSSFLWNPVQMQIWPNFQIREPKRISCSLISKLTQRWNQIGHPEMHQRVDRSCTFSRTSDSSGVWHGCHHPQSENICWVRIVTHSAFLEITSDHSRSLHRCHLGHLLWAEPEIVDTAAAWVRNAYYTRWRRQHSYSQTRMAIVLKNVENKQELFSFIGKQLAKTDWRKTPPQHRLWEGTLQ